MSDVNVPNAVGGVGTGETADLPGYFPQLTKAAREQLIDRFGADGLPKTMSDLASSIARIGGGKEKADTNGTEPRKQVDKPDVPDSPDGYTFDEIKLPDGMQRDPLFESYLREVGVKGKLTKEQATVLYKGFHEDYAARARTKMQEFIEQQKPEAEKVLRDAWGDKYDDQLSNAEKVLHTFGDDDLMTAFNGSAPKVQATIRRFAARIGEKMAPDSFVIPEGPADAPKPKPGTFSYGFDPTAKR